MVRSIVYQSTHQLLSVCTNPCRYCSTKIKSMSSVSVSADSYTATTDSCSGNSKGLDDRTIPAVDMVSVKRVSEDFEDAGKSKCQKLSKIDSDVSTLRKKKVALLLVYSGKGYLGMQKNPGCKTIEADLFDALVKAGLVRPDHIEQPGVKMGYQRAARTDKGVSAAGQVVSVKMLIDIENPTNKINEHLPQQIRVLGIKRTTKGFDAKNSCNSRTYIYVVPTFAFADVPQEMASDYRITEEVLARVQEILNNYKGSHNFHNFTSGKKHNDPSARRYIMDFMIDRPFERDGIEYVVLKVRGQSFMLHQIRKMIGLTIAICRGYVSITEIEKAWDSEKVDVPKAPGHGLVLERLHYDKYNKKFGNDGVHESIQWDSYEDELNDFKEKVIYPVIFTAEKEENLMQQWLSTLSKHSFYQQSNDQSQETMRLEAVTTDIVCSNDVHNINNDASTVGSQNSVAVDT